MKNSYLIFLALVAGLSVIIFLSALGVVKFKTFLRSNSSVTAVDNSSEMSTLLTPTPNPIKYGQTTDLQKELDKINPEVNEGDFNAGISQK